MFSHKTKGHNFASQLNKTMLSTQKPYTAVFKICKETLLLTMWLALALASTPPKSPSQAGSLKDPPTDFK